MAEDLHGVDLTGATLRDASFERTDLSDALLTKADARRAKFISATLRKARLDHADMVRADFTNADLTGASLVGVDLDHGANVSCRSDPGGLDRGPTGRHRSPEGGPGGRHLDRRQDGAAAEDHGGRCHPAPQGHSVNAAEPSG